MQLKKNKIVLSDEDCAYIDKRAQEDQNKELIYLEYIMEIISKQKDTLPENFLIGDNKNQFINKTRKYRALIRSMNRQTYDIFKFIEFCSVSKEKIISNIQKKVQTRAILFILFSLACFILIQVTNINPFVLFIMKYLYTTVMFICAITIGIKLLQINLIQKSENNLG